MVELSDDFAEDCICWVVCYTQVGLLSYTIQTTRDLMEVIRDNAGVTRKPSEIDQIGKLMGNTEVAAQRRTTGARMSKKARADTQGCATGCKEAVEASEPDRGLESGSSSSQEDLPEEPVHMAHTDPPGPEEAAVLPQDPGPRFDAGTGRVFASDGLYLGRISVVRPGQNSEALSVYCSAHGCTVCKSMRKGVPSTSSLINWLAAGRDMPVGRQAGFQRTHKRSFPAAA